MDQNTAMRRAQHRHDSAEEPGSAAPFLLGPVDEAIQYVREARRAGAQETPFELLCEATRDLATRAQAAWFLGLPRLATTTAIQRPMASIDVCWALDTLAATLSAGWRAAVGPALVESRRAEVLALLGGTR